MSRIVCHPWLLALAVTVLAAAAGRAQDPPPSETKPETESELLKPGVHKLFDGQSLAHWKIADQFDFTDHGAVRIDGDRLVLSAGMPATGIVLAHEPPRINYELTLEARRVEGRDFFCGLTFPVGEGYCTLILGGWGGGVIGLSNVDKYSAVENATTTSREFTARKWYPVRLRVTEQAISVWLEDERIIHQEVPGHVFQVWWEMEPMRPLGIATWYTSGELRAIRLRHPVDEAREPADDSGSDPSGP